MKIRNTEHGVRFLRDDREPVDISVIYDDPIRGTWLLVSTKHDAAEVRITPAGRKVTSNDDSNLRTHHITGDADE